MKLLPSIVLTVLFYIGVITVHAHSGRTDGDGGHYDWTECEPTYHSHAFQG